MRSLVNIHGWDVISIYTVEIRMEIKMIALENE